MIGIFNNNSSSVLGCASHIESMVYNPRRTMYDPHSIYIYIYTYVYRGYSNDLIFFSSIYDLWGPRDSLAALIGIGLAAGHRRTVHITSQEAGPMYGAMVPYAPEVGIV